MSKIDPAVEYLRISSAYSMYLGYVRWSQSGDALVFDSSATFALSDEVEALLEGVFAGPSVPPFSYVLMLLHEFRKPMWMRELEYCASFDRVRGVYRAAHGTESLARNTGLLISELCRSVPGAVSTVSFRDVKLALTRCRLFPSDLSQLATHELPIDPNTLLKLVAQSTPFRDPDSFAHWFQHGCAPTTAGEQLAEPVESVAQRVTSLIDLARSDPRLVGAASLVPAFDAALTLPPRKRQRSEVPQGGYSDVSTRGDPDRLLPSQFALDPDDFVRRFAERELLYFDREEPHTRQRPERVLVLDQGVRTWGGVRLGLAGAALAMLGKDRKKAGPIRIVNTNEASADGQTTPDLTATLLQASDLTEHPAAAIRTVLAEDATLPREIVLLTHPRAMGERPVSEACNLKGPADRLFYLTVDARGHAELGEWGVAGPLSIRSFRVDLEAAEAVRVPEPVTRPTSDRPAIVSPAGWTGDVEPIPFPFRPGLLGVPVRLGFSAEGDWCVAVAQNGVPHAIRVEDNTVEVFPRAIYGGFLLKGVEAVLGVNNGVVLCGRLQCLSAVASFSAFVAAHYDFKSRRLRCHAFFARSANSHVDWFVNPELNCVILRPRGDAQIPGAALDLTTDARFFADAQNAGPEAVRARNAWHKSPKGSAPHDVWSPNARVKLTQEEHSLRLAGADTPWDRFVPLSDGEPILARDTIHSAQLAGNVLALCLREKQRMSLMLCRGPKGHIIRHGHTVDSAGLYALSPTGSRMAFRHARWEVRVTDTSTSAPILATTGAARLHNSVRLTLIESPFTLAIDVGSARHRFTLETGRLGHTLDQQGIRPVQKSCERLPTTFDYDPGRFVAGESIAGTRLLAVFDHFGQVLLTTPAGETVVSFLVRRGKVAAWMPPNVYWGDIALTGVASTPDASDRIGAAIARQLEN